MYFEWDAAKADLNWKKHGVSFLEARSVFDDFDALLIADPDHSTDEERFVLLGTSYKMRVLIVVHCERSKREEEERVRISSSRKATPRETAQYRRRKS